MNKENLKELFLKIKENKITIDEAIDNFKDYPFKDLDFVKLDLHRDSRKSLGEVIYCKNKTKEQLEIICKELLKSNKETILYSKINKEKAEILLSIDKKLEYNKKAKIVFKGKKNPINNNKILVCSGGTTDIPVAEEASCTAEIMGNIVERHYDVGIAGIYRLFSIYDRLQNAKVIIAIAGMEGALPGVISGLVDVPVIAVPTSIGYGANFKGLSALLSMLTSCSPGIAVVNIDNGFGAGYLASLINKRSE